MEKIKILHVVRKMDIGGVQTFLMSYYREMYKEIQFDFLVEKGSQGAFDEEIKDMGGRIIEIEKSESFFQHMLQMFMVFRKNDYQTIHAHRNFFNVYIIFLAWINKIPERICHSHNVYPSKGRLERLAKTLASYLLQKFSTNKVACSIEAGEWLYKNSNFTVINNAINIEDYLFNNEQRINLRKELNCSENFLIGHVGSLVDQKNQQFLIEMMPKLLKDIPNACLILVGDGANRHNIEMSIKKNRLEDSVILIGKEKNVAQYYNAFDVFVLPSNFEGLGIVMIEAQINGLHYVYSNKVPSSADILQNGKELDIDDSTKWLNELKKVSQKGLGYGRKIDRKKFDRFNIQIQASSLKKLYLEGEKNK